MYPPGRLEYRCARGPNSLGKMSSGRCWGEELAEKGGGEREVEGKESPKHGSLGGSTNILAMALLRAASVPRLPSVMHFSTSRWASLALG